MGNLIGLAFQFVANALKIPAIPRVVYVAAAIVSVGVVTLIWAYSTWHDFKEGLIAQGRQECRSEVERATSEARRLHVIELQRQAADFQRKLQETERARQEAAAKVARINEQQRETYAELARLREDNPTPPECRLTDAQVDALNGTKRAPASSSPVSDVPPPPPLPKKENRK